MAAAIGTITEVTISGGTTATTAGITTTTGDTLFVASMGDPAAATFNTPTDNKTNTFTVLTGGVLATGSIKQGVWTKQNAAGGTGHTATATFASAHDFTIFFGNVTGALAASLDSASAQNSDASSPYTVTTGTLAQAGNLAVLIISSNSGGNPVTYTESTGFSTAAAETNGNSAWWTGAILTKHTAATTALTPSVTINTGTGWECIVACLIFKDSAATGITGAGQIASGQAFGAPIIGAGIAAAGIASAGALGAPIIGAQVTGAGAIGTAEALGQPIIGAGIAAAGIASGQAIGQPAIGATIQGGSIASGEAFGTPTIGGIAGAGGIASGEAIGSPALAAGVAPAGIPSAEAVGAPIVGAGIAGAGAIGTAEAVGSPSIGAGITGGSIPSGEAPGAPAVGAQITGAGGIASAEAIGQPIIAGTGVFMAGIPSAEAFGQPSIGSGIGGAGGIASGEGVGSPIVGQPPAAPAGGIGAGFEVDVGAAKPRRRVRGERVAQAQAGERRAQEAPKAPAFTYRKPILQRVLEERYPKVKPKKERAQKRAKTIELQAAALVLEKPITGETQFKALARQWAQQRPYVPEALADVPMLDLFEAQVAFRIRQQQLEDRALQMLDARRAQDEEDALIALLLA